MEQKTIDWKRKSTPKGIKVGDIIEWDDVPDVYRGYYRSHKATVEEVFGRNIVTVGGDYLYWTNLKKCPNFKVTSCQAKKEGAVQ